jgi:hypothetical protein
VIGLAQEFFDLVPVIKAEFRESENLPAFDMPQLVVTLVDGYAVKPGKEWPPVVELSEREIYFGEDLLGDVLDIIAVADIVIDDVEYRLLV